MFFYSCSSLFSCSSVAFSSTLGAFSADSCSSLPLPSSFSRTLVTEAISSSPFSRISLTPMVFLPSVLTSATPHPDGNTFLGDDHQVLFFHTFDPLNRDQISGFASHVQGFDALTPSVGHSVFRNWGLFSKSFF